MIGSFSIIFFALSASTNTTPSANSLACLNLFRAKHEGREVIALRNFSRASLSLKEFLELRGFRYLSRLSAAILASLVLDDILSNLGYNVSSELNELLHPTALTEVERTRLELIAYQRWSDTLTAFVGSSPDPQSKEALEVLALIKLSSDRALRSHVEHFEPLKSRSEK